LWPIGERRHHLYVIVQGSQRHHERIAFREYLCSQQAEFAERAPDAGWVVEPVVRLVTLLRFVGLGDDLAQGERMKARCDSRL
jgi:hypothetical protein